MAALLYMKHVYALCDEDTVERWSENPYWQHLSGERYFQHELPCDPSSLVRWMILPHLRVPLQVCIGLLAIAASAIKSPPPLPEASGTG